MIRRIALAMIVFNVACVALNFHLRRWECVLTDFTDVLQWGLVWTLATQIDRLEEQSRPTGA